jgi:hypothetical protein
MSPATRRRCSIRLHVSGAWFRFATSELCVTGSITGRIADTTGHTKCTDRIGLTTDRDTTSRRAATVIIAGMGSSFGLGGRATMGIAVVSASGSGGDGSRPTL